MQDEFEKEAALRMIGDMRREREEGAIPAVEQANEYVRRGVGEMWRKIAADLVAGAGWSEEDARRFVDQRAIRFYGSEFAEALDNHGDDAFGWTLDEHLRFIVDERELD